MMRKFIITAEMRDLEKQVSEEDISYSRMIELLNEKAEKWYYDKLLLDETRKRYFYVSYEYSEFFNVKKTNYATFSTVGFFNKDNFIETISKAENKKFTYFIITNIIELNELDYISFIK